REGKPEPALVRALSDSQPRRRIAAAEALAHAAGPGLQLALRKLLPDPDPSVRLRVALALAAARDKDAVPVLIDSLANLTPELAGQAHDALCLLGGDKRPQEPLGRDAAARQKCRDAWASWWHAHAAAADLARLDTKSPLLG